MKKAIKLNVLLALTEALGKNFSTIIREYTQYFKNNQSDFKGIKKTYVPQEGTVDYPTERQFTKVVTTVDEKLDYFEKTTSQYIDALLNQEKTNATGNAKAELFVEGVSWGTFSSLELLRIKSILDSQDIHNMYQQIPVISDNEIWEKATLEDYKDRAIFQQPMVSTEKKTTVKEMYILQDPNLAGKTSLEGYVPQTAVKDTTQKLGDQTLQVYSGATTHHRRAAILQRLTNLRVGVIEALKVANEVESEQSELTAGKLFSYLHRGI